MIFSASGGRPYFLFEVAVKFLRSAERMLRREDALGEAGRELAADLRRAGLEEHRVTLRGAAQH
jgi:hypothetical protein